MASYKRIGMTVKSGLAERDAAAETVLSILQDLDATILIDGKRASGLRCGENLPTYESTEEIDLLLIVGGDGTILRSIREMHDFSVPILSVNRGRVGFLAEVELDEAGDVLPSLLCGEGILDERQLLFVRAERDSEEHMSGFALNEAVIAQGTIARLVDLETSVDSEPLTTFHADGLIIASPTGSTAYSLSAGGPIVHPSLRAMILTPINPHSFSQKPVVIRSDSEVRIVVQTKETKHSDADVILTLDGQTYVTLTQGSTVTICGSDQSVTFLRRAQDTFFGTLRQKLKWGERLED